MKQDETRLKQQYSTNLLISGWGGICCAQEPPDLAEYWVSRTTQ